MSILQQVSKSLCFHGQIHRVLIESKICNGAKILSTILTPPKRSPEDQRPSPVLYFLAGPEWNDQGLFLYGGQNEFFAKSGLTVVSCSPRFAPANPSISSVNEGSSNEGFSMFLDAPGEGKSQMKLFSFVNEELQSIVEKNFAVEPSLKSIFGISTGGTAALLASARDPKKYQSVSAFRPITHPQSSPVGRKFLEDHLGPEDASWKNWDLIDTVRNSKAELKCPLIDQGYLDEAMVVRKEIQTEALRDAYKAVSQPVVLRLRAGYDGSPYFFSTYLKEHLNHHKAALSK